MMKHAPQGAFFMVALWLLACPARAELTIEIAQRLESAKPIAVADFSGPQAGDNIAQIVRQDLAHSGDFEPVAVAAQDEDAMKSAAGPTWRVRGTTRRTADGLYQFAYQVYDASSAAIVLEQSLSAGNGRWREIAHLISDRIYEALTGTRGAASTRLLYVQEQRQRGQARYRLQLSDSDGQRAMTILESPQPIMAPAWSPSAREVAYVSFESGEPGIYVHDLGSRIRRFVTEGKGLAAAPAWSPDGRQLAFSLSQGGNPDIYVLELATGAFQRLTSHPAIDTEPRWSGDGKSLYFTSDRGGTAQVYRMSSTGGDAKRVTFQGRFNARSAVSPTGDRLAFVHQDASGFQIATQDLKTGMMSDVTQSPLDGAPSFAPNGRLLIYSTRQGSRSQLGISTVDGRFSMRLPTLDGQVREPAWSPFLK